MKRNTIRFGAVLMALMLLISGVAGAAAAASWDTETTNTTTTSDISGTSTTIQFDRGNSSKTIYVEVTNASSDNLTLEMTPADPELDTVVYENSTWATEDSTNGHYSVNFSHAELEDVPATADSGTFNVSVYENGTLEDSSELVLDQSQQDTPTAVMWVTDNSGTDAATSTDLVADTYDQESETSWLFFDSSFQTYSSFIQIDPANASTTEIHLQNESVRSEMANETEGLESGDVVRSQKMFANSGPALMYYNEAPESANTNVTYLTYDNSSDVVVVHHGDDLSSVNQLHVSATVGDGYDWGYAAENFGYGTAWDLAYGAAADSIPYVG